MKNLNNKKITLEEFENAQKSFSGRKISDDRKAQMLSNIYAASPSPIPSPLNPYMTFFKQRSFVLATALVLLLSGTTYASAQSLPGDVLYKVKTNILEPINLSLHFSEESKIEYKNKLAEKRIEEQEKLIEKGVIVLEKKKDETKEEIKEEKKDVRAVPIKLNTSIETEVEIEAEDNDEAEVNIEVETEIETEVEVKEETKKEVKKTVGNATDSVSGSGSGSVGGVLGL